MTKSLWLIGSIGAALAVAAGTSANAQSAKAEPRAVI